MERLIQLYNKLDALLTAWMRRHGINMLRKSIGFIFLWFGILKFFPGLSPAEGIAVETIRAMTFGIPGDKLIINGLATLETLIGAGLLFNLFMRGTLFLLFVQMAGTFFPIILFPEAVFAEFPVGLTLEGQYIIKNLVIVSAGIVIGSTVRKPAENSHPESR